MEDWNPDVENGRISSWKMGRKRERRKRQRTRHYMRRCGENVNTTMEKSNQEGS
jgi:hypothetical protein